MEYYALKFIHVLAAVFMSVPLYNLIVVNERGRMGMDMPLQVDRYFENIIRGGSRRCFVFQLTVLLSGVAILLTRNLGISYLWENWVVMLKTVILFGLTGLLANVHFNIQPKIDKLIESVKDGEIPDDVRKQIAPLRGQRKLLAAICLFLLITEIILGVQVYMQFPIWFSLVLAIFGALFTRHAYRSLLPYGWV